MPGQLYMLGGLLHLDGRLSWASQNARGYQPLNCYLVIEPRRSTLIDTGLGLHEQLVVDGLRQIVPPDRPLSIFLTRAEYECIGNLAAIFAATAVEKLYSGGSNNPFDTFDEVTSPYWSNRVRLGKTPTGKPLPLGDSVQLEVVAPVLRILSTYWAYDRGTKTLFTSDLFAHMLLTEKDQSRLITATSDDRSTVESVRAELLAKFAWLPAASKAGALIENLDAMFSEREVEIIAPTHGCALVGRTVVDRHYQLVRRILTDIDQRAVAHRPRTGSASAEARVGPITPTPAFGEARAIPRHPREVAPGIHWLGGCLDTEGRTIRGEPFHVHVSNYLVRGGSQSLLVDTGPPWNWEKVEEYLDRLLGERPLDWIFPTHAEYPHSGNLGKLLAKYPAARVIGDVRDYHVLWPSSADRLIHKQPGDAVDLGGGYVVEFIDGLLKDLPGTLWAYERSQKVIFVADGFGFSHREPVIPADEDGPVHLAGECAHTVSELLTPFATERAAIQVKGVHNWGLYVDPGPIFSRMHEVLNDHPTSLIAPAHGNVIDRPSEVIPVMEEAHYLLYREGK